MKTIHFDSLYSAHYYFDLATRENSFTDKLYNFITDNFKNHVQEVDAVVNDTDIAINDFAKQHGFDKCYSAECVKWFDEESDDETYNKFFALWDKARDAEKASEKLEQLERLLSDALYLASEIEELTDATTEEK